MKITPASHADAQALSQVAVAAYTETFGYLYTKDNLDTHLAKTCSADYFRGALDAGDVIYLAFLGKALAGYVKCGALGLPAHNVEPDASELHRLYVLKPYHGRGLGKALMDAALESAPLKHSPAIYLGVWEHNLKAQQFYSRYGFVPHGEYTYWVGSHADREFIYKREQKG